MIHELKSFGSIKKKVRFLSHHHNNILRLYGYGKYNMGVCKREFPWPISVATFSRKRPRKVIHLRFVKIAKDLTGPPLKPSMERLQKTVEQEASGGGFPALMYTRHMFSKTSRSSRNSQLSVKKSRFP